jgi:hypothetical protein
VKSLRLLRDAQQIASQGEIILAIMLGNTPLASDGDTSLHLEQLESSAGTPSPWGLTHEPESSLSSPQRNTSINNSVNSPLKEDISDVLLITRAWINEKFSPDLLPFEHTSVNNLMELMEFQVRLIFQTLYMCLLIWDLNPF